MKEKPAGGLVNQFEPFFYAVFPVIHDEFSTVLGIYDRTIDANIAEFSIEPVEKGCNLPFSVA